MYTTKLTYPIFKIDDTANAGERILAKAVSEINLRYFNTHPRFKKIGRVSSPILVDYMCIYEEGDKWDLTIVRVLGKNGQPKYLFLPLVADIESEMETKISTFVPINFGDVTFGLEIPSQIKGSRHLKMVDAFSDFGFIIKMINLFLPWENLDGDHINAYTNITESGLGKFIFHSTQNFQKEWEYSSGIGVLPELTKTGNILLNYGGKYRLVINSVLSTATDFPSLQSDPSISGWITYSGPQTPELIIGILGKL